MIAFPVTGNWPMPAPVSPGQAPCKCCGTPSPLFGVIDFHENCERIRRKVLDLSGIPIYYHRCPGCCFLFTTAFDHFSPQDWRDHVYNDQYHLVDPEYLDQRPHNNANFVASLFSRGKPRRLLDYGGGNGLLAECLRNLGFSETHCYDPFAAGFDRRPDGQFDCITAFEVVEHSTKPLEIFADMCSLLTDDGLLVFSTLLQPADVEKQGMQWWYISPRNGHVSFYATKTLAAIGQRVRINFGSIDDNKHVAFRKVPEFARHLFKNTKAK